MALQLPFTSPDGVDHPDAYWRVVQVNLSPADKTGRITLLAYHNKESRESNKDSVGQRAYDINGELYEEYFSPPVFEEGDNHISQAYKAAKEIKDVETGEQDEDGNPIKESFFEEATDV